MSNITRAVSDVKTFRTVHPIKDRKAFTGNFYHLYPIFHRFCCPNDIWKSTCQAFIRLQPMLAPPLTENNLRVRWFFVSLRQIEPDLTPLIITGSNDGKLSEETLPEFPSVWEYYDKYNPENEDITINVNSIGHIFFNIPVGTYSSTDISVLNKSEASPRLYWFKAFLRILWDYYRDENLGFEFLSNAANFDSFDDWYTNQIYYYDEDLETYVYRPFLESKCPSVLLKKDYFTTSSPWILKGTQPTISASFITPTLTWNTTEIPKNKNGEITHSTVAGFQPDANYPESAGLVIGGDYASDSSVIVNANVQKFLDNIEIGSQGFGFNMSEWRDMMAHTKVLERLARTGSRYTEYHAILTY